MKIIFFLFLLPIAFAHWNFVQITQQDTSIKEINIRVDDQECSDKIEIVNNL